MNVIKSIIDVAEKDGQGLTEEDSMELTELQNELDNVQYMKKRLEAHL